MTNRTYEEAVFFIRNQGFIRYTAARKITLEDSLSFERLHEEPTATSDSGSPTYPPGRSGSGSRSSSGRSPRKAREERLAGGGTT